jgi:hypothetical protein
MSVQVISWAIKQQLPTPSDKLVLIILSNYADAEGRCWPHVDTIARDASLSVRTVRSCLARLDGEFLTIEKKRGKSGQQSASTYRLILDKPECNMAPNQSAIPAPSEKPECNLPSNQGEIHVEPECNLQQNQSARVAVIYKDDPSYRSVIDPSIDPSGSTPVGAATWNAYFLAYENRYGVGPIRNAKVNGQIAQFVKRVGAEEAPHIASYYLTNKNSYYLGRGHSVDCLLSDAEKLRMEWATDRQVTATQARQEDKTSTTGDQIKRLIEKSKRGEL